MRSNWQGEVAAVRWVQPSTAGLSTTVPRKRTSSTRQTDADYNYGIDCDVPDDGEEDEDFVLSSSVCKGKAVVGFRLEQAGTCIRYTPTYATRAHWRRAYTPFAHSGV